MSSKQELQHIMQQIKQGQAFTGTFAPVSHTFAPSAHGGGDTDIMTMQHALQDLARDIAAPVSLQADPSRQEELEAFKNFLSNNYLRVSRLSEEAQSDTGVMHNLQQITDPKVKFVNGDWGATTQMALLNVWTFADALLNFVEDVNKISHRKIKTDYTKGNLNYWKDLPKVPPENLKQATLQAKSKASAEVTPQLVAIKKLYDQVKNQVMGHAAFQSFTEVDTTHKSYVSPVSPEQVAALKKQFESGLDVTLEKGKTKVPIDALTDIRLLQNWLSQHQSQMTPEQIVSQIYQQYVRAELGYQQYFRTE